MREGGTYQLDNRQLEFVRQNREMLEPMYLSALFGPRDNGEYTSREVALGRAAMRQAPGQIGAELAGEDSGLTADQILASVTDEVRARGLSEFTGRLEQRGQAVPISDVSRELGFVEEPRYNRDGDIVGTRTRSLAGLTEEEYAQVMQEVRSTSSGGNTTPAAVERAVQTVLSRQIESRRYTPTTGRQGRIIRSVEDQRSADLRAASDRARGISSRFGDSTRASEVVTQIRQISEGGNALGAMGAVIGAAAGDQNLEELTSFVESGGGTFSGLSGAGLQEALRAYAQVYRGDRPGSEALAGINATLDELERRYEGDEGAEARIRSVRSAVTGEGGLAPSSLTPGQIGFVTQAQAQDPSTINEALTQYRLTENAARAAGSAVINAQSEEALAQMRLNVLSDGGLTSLMMDDASQQFGGMSLADINRAVRMGTLTGAQATAVLEDPSLRARLTEIAGGTGPGAESAQQLLNRVRALSSGGGFTGASTQLSSRLASILEDNEITESELRELNGLNIQTNIQALGQIMSGAEGVSADTLTQVFGSRAAAAAFAQRMGTDVDGLLAQIQGGQLSSSAQEELLARLVGVTSLGQDEGRRQDEQEIRQLERTYLESMNRLLGGPSSGGGQALPVAVIATPDSPLNFTVAED